MKIIDHVRGQAHFQYYRKSMLVYKTDSGLVFEVPIDDTGDASFPATDKALFFMRWIRQALKDHQQAALDELGLENERLGLT